MSLLNQEMTDHDLAAWMDDLLTRIELRAMMEHEVIDHQGDDAVFQNRCPQVCELVQRDRSLAFGYWRRRS